MTKSEYTALQKEISNLYESVKYKDYNSKEREGGKEVLSCREV